MAPTNLLPTVRIPAAIGTCMSSGTESSTRRATAAEGVIPWSISTVRQASKQRSSPALGMRPVTMK